MSNRIPKKPFRAVPLHEHQGFAWHSFELCHFRRESVYQQCFLLLPSFTRFAYSGVENRDWEKVVFWQW